MKPILLIHGYSSEGKSSKVEDIYGTLPEELRKLFGKDAVKDINLSRWISLNDGISLDDVSFAMQRALQAKFPDLLKNGFHVIIHSTGALVVRNWIRKFSPKPSPIENLIHLAGANFGSGLAHIGQGQLARWGRFIFQGTGRGTRVLKELEFGSWRTLDLQRFFIEEGNDMYHAYKVQEFCLIGSQTLGMLRPIPIRYIKEDSADNTVRTSAGNLNYSYIAVNPKESALKITRKGLGDLIEKRLNNESFDDEHYEFDLDHLSQDKIEVPFAILFETAHFGGDIGIVTGKDNRNEVMPLIKIALETPYSQEAYHAAANKFRAALESTFERAKKLKSTILEWNKQEQYEGHAQIIFRLRDQFGNGAEHFDITFKSDTKSKGKYRLESMIEDKHSNGFNQGTITFYLRTQKFENNVWEELLENVFSVDVEITAYEPLSGDISYIPLNLRLNPDQIRTIVKTFRTTIIDIQLLRLPTENVFKITKV